MVNLIGINGKIGHGKDTVGTIIQELTSGEWQIKKFAAKLKEVTALLTGVTAKDLELEKVKSSNLPEIWNKNGLPITYRQMLQWIGTEAMRDNVHENVWVNSLFADYHLASKWLVTDMRFPNELKSIQDRGGLTIRVVRDSIISISTHPSETGLDEYKFDHVILNNGSLEDLTYKVKSMLDKFNIQ